MTGVITEMQYTLDVFSFLCVVFVYLLSLGIAKFSYIRHALGDHDVELKTRDSTHILDKILFGIGILIIVYEIIFSKIDPLIEFMKSYDSFNFIFLAASIPAMLLLVFGKKVIVSLERDRSVSAILHTCFTEFFLLVFYASFCAVIISILLFTVAGGN
jgi:hypothetical protein